MIDPFRPRWNGAEGIVPATLLTRVEIMFYPWEEVEQTSKASGRFFG
jgi:hypothetical protein